MKIKCNIKEILEAKDKDYSWLAKEAKVSNSTITNMVHQKYKSPGLGNALKVARALKKPILTVWTVTF